MTGNNSIGKITTGILLVTTYFLALIYPVPASAAESWYYYQVEQGDFLWLIGWKFETNVDSIMSLNGLKTSEIYPGQSLKIPSSTGFTREIPKTVRYSVVKGDSLYTVAQKFGTTVNKIMAANNMSSTNLLVGQSLIIELPLQKRYTVQSGDTLFLVAERFNTTIDALKLVNRINGQALWVGQVLFVPDNGGTSQPSGNIPVVGTLPPVSSIDYSQKLPKIGSWGQIPEGVVLDHVKEGDNLWSIAQRYGTTADAIVKTNHLRSDIIQVNQPLFIPQNSTKPAAIPFPTGITNQGYGELMDWEYVSWIADTRSVFTIKDITTGKSFNARRYGGSNHMDSEPLTAVDSAIMKEIFGQWSWSSRPILVYIDGKVLAGSMSGMPHSYDSIPENNFAGHFDMYFLNSITHYNSTLVPEHQKAVLTAAGVVQ